MRYTLRPATLEDGVRLLQDVREEDRREWEDATGLPLDLQLMAALSGNSKALTVAHAGLPYGPPLLIWGVDFVSKHLGQVWLIATNAAMKSATSLHSIAPEALFLLDAKYPTTVAYADPRNATHLRWLRRMGWREVRTIPTGPTGLPYIQFERTANVSPSTGYRLNGGRPRGFGGAASSGGR